MHVLPTYEYYANVGAVCSAQLRPSRKDGFKHGFNTEALAQVCSMYYGSELMQTDRWMREAKYSPVLHTQ